jgi:hypothetical protein
MTVHVALEASLDMLRHDCEELRKRTFFESLKTAEYYVYSTEGQSPSVE